MSKTVLVTGSNMVPQAAMDYIESRGYQVRHAPSDTFSEQELADALSNVSGYLIGGYEEPTASNFEAAHALEAIAWLGTDYKAYVPGWKRAVELGIAIINSPGTNAISVAEFTVLLMLTMARPFTAQILQQGQTTADLTEPGQDLYKHTLGIVGLGRIGSRVARIASLGFEMNVVYSAPRRSEAVENALGITYAPRDTLFAVSDIVSFHRPSLAADEPYELGSHELSLVKSGAILINTVQPRLFDFAALVHPIQEKHLRVAIDGNGSGPDWDRLIALGPERFLAVPSMAFNTGDANFRASMRTAEAVCNVLDGETSPDVNNPDYRQKRAARGNQENDAT